MEQTSQREIRAIDPTWTIADITARLAKALADEGPAITLGPISVETVPSEIAVVVSTSGSTGDAKEVGLSAAAIFASAKATNKFFGASAGQTWSLLLPLTHIAGINVLARALELGTVPIDARGITSKYPDADYTAIVPTQLFRALNGDGDLLAHLQSAKSVLVGGAALDKNLGDQARTAGINIVESYGMTETCGGCVYDGLPISDTSVEINKDGLIKISTASLATTYLNDVSGWSSKLEDGYFLTSDLGEIKGGKLTVTGRADDVIVTGGENISLTKVEEVIRNTFAGIECAAFGIADEQCNQSLSSQISAAAKVKGAIYLDQLPRTALDKVNRQELANLALMEGR